MTADFPAGGLRLSELLGPDQVVRDGVFFQLDQTAATAPGSLVYCATLKFLRSALENANVAAVLTTAELAARVTSLPVAVSPAPRLEFFRLYKRLSEAGVLRPRMEFGRGEGCRVHPTAVVSDRSLLGRGVVVEARAFVGDHVRLGDGAYVGQGASIGVDGLMPVWDEAGLAIRFSHAGSVTIGENTVILAGTTVVTSVFQRPTSIGHDSYVGLLANVGHDARVGSRCIIGGNCVIAGAAVVEDGAQVWASSTVSHGITVGRDARVQIGSVVIDDVEAGRSVSGNFARNHRRHAIERLGRPR